MVPASRTTTLLMSAALLFVVAASVAYALVSLHTHKVLTVAFLDVGQGDAIFIETPSGVQMLVDGGSGAQVLRALSTQLSFFDRDIDVVVATHPDSDHIGGLTDVLRRYRVGTMVDSGIREHERDATALMRVAHEKGVSVVALRAGEYIDLGDGVYAQVLSPTVMIDNIDPNVGSLVVRIIYKNTSFLLTADAPAEIEQALVRRYGNTLHSTVLKLGHHGSRSSSDLSFLRAVHPDVAVVSAGCHNRYGHPHNEVLARLTQLNIPVRSTCASGTVVFESDGKNVIAR